MSTGPWPGDMLRLLTAIEQTVDTALERMPTLTRYTLGVVVTAGGEPVARLYEEGWDFSEKERIR